MRSEPCLGLPMAVRKTQNRDADRWLGERQMHRECRTGAGLRRDLQPAVVAGKDMLDQREPKAGAALGTALANVDAIEALRKAGQMLGGDARPVIADRDARLRLVRRGLHAGRLDVDALAERKRGV